MTELQADLLELLKCDECNSYLSYPPIFICNDKNICGRCSVENEKKIRNVVYENLANVVLFPCPVLSCTKKYSMKQMKMHEDLTHGIACPTLPNGCCKWKGTITNIYQHFKNDHSDFIITNPFKAKPKLENCENCLMMKMNGFLFTIHTKYNDETTKLSYSATLLDDDNLCELFEYSLELIGIEGRIIKNRQVLSLNKNGNENIIENNINKIQKSLGSEYENLDFIFKIEMHDEICESCEEPLTKYPIHCRDKNFYCSDCVWNEDDKSEETEEFERNKNLIQDENSGYELFLINTSVDEEGNKKDHKIPLKDFEKLLYQIALESPEHNNSSVPSGSQNEPTQCFSGLQVQEPAVQSVTYKCTNLNCRYEDADVKNLRKHEIWFCNYAAKKCRWGCTRRYIESNLLEHFKSHCEFRDSHEDQINLENPLSLFYPRIINSYEWYMGFIEIGNKIFIYRMKIEEFVLNISIVTNFPLELIPYFRVEIGLRDDQSDFELVCKVKSCSWEETNNFYDFNLALKKTFLFCITDLGECYLSLKINKYRDGCLHDMDRHIVMTSIRSTYVCKNFETGCTYINSLENNVKKHERWFCTKKPINCRWGCSLTISTGQSLFSHYLAYCEVVQPENNMVKITDLTTDFWYKYVIMVNRLKVLCRFRLTERSIDIFMVTNLPAEMIDKYRWVFGLSHCDTNLYYKEKIKLNVWNDDRHLWDYHFQSSNNYEPFINEFQDTYNIVFVLIPLCEECKNDNFN